MNNIDMDKAKFYSITFNNIMTNGRDEKFYYYTYDGKTFYEYFSLAEAKLVRNGILESNDSSKEYIYRPTYALIVNNILLYKESYNSDAFIVSEIELDNTLNIGTYMMKKISIEEFKTATETTNIKNMIMKHISFIEQAINECSLEDTKKTKRLGFINKLINHKNKKGI